MKYDVVGVGDAAYDNLCIIERYPEEDGSTHILEIHNQGGGCVGTALVAARRLGFSAAYIGNTGDDYAGEHIRTEFVKEGVNIDNVDVIAGKRSGIGYVMIDPVKSTRTKFPYKNNLPDIEWNEDKKEMIRNAKILHIDGTNYNNCITAARVAKEAGVTVSYDGCSKRKPSSLNAEMASLSDILIMNESFPYYVSGKDNLEEAMKYFENIGPKIIISTLGKRGCVALVNGELVYYPAFKVKAIDTTGAGDSFHGGFVAGYLRGYSLEENIRYASAVAAMKCLKIGGRAGLPTHEEVIEFINNNEY
jgi:sugar/nucleoside kinase (ribokinase family)